MWEKIVLIIILLSMVWTDFKERYIHLFSILSLFILGLWSVQTYDWTFWLYETGYNLIFVMTQLIGLYLYLQVRYKEGNQLFKKWLGIGDVFFFLCLCFLFTFQVFIAIYLSGLIFSILMVLIFKKYFKTIPLAGLFSLFLIIYLLTPFQQSLI
ncbi:MAG: hypothetical protein N4A45_10820 [Flavobacteriales bacterium]|jgi:hypothetical protein|nr:hypothetical protein [Flavobacteriales bacterium]